MSEYRYYEFLAIDRPLDEREMAALRGISSRADVTPTRFANEYDYGDLKADPGKLLERYFDVHVFVTNWGPRQLAMRLPHEAMAEEDLATWLGEGTIARRAGAHLILELWSEAEDYEDWIDAPSWMGSLAGVRAQLIRGDQRPLYLAWLLGLHLGDYEEEDEEPPVPAGLGQLPASLTALVQFLRIDEHLVSAAAEASPPEQPEPDGLASWIAQLPPAEKDALLLRAAQGEHALVAATLARRFRTQARQDDASPALQRRTAAAIVARADQLREAERRRQAEAKAAARDQRRAAAALAKTKRLDALAQRQPAAWQQVEQWIASMAPKAYDRAVSLLLELRDLARREGDEPAFMQRLRDLHQQHARKTTFIARLEQAGLRAR